MPDVVKLITVYATVSAVDKRSAARSARKLADGTIAIDREDLGWFLALKEFGIAIGVGDEQPELRAGQRVKLTIEGL